MKKKYLLLPCLFVISMAACKKSDESGKEIIDNRQPEQVVQAITAELSAVPEVSTFTNALKNVALSKEETSQGLTMFAPVNTESGTASVKKLKQSLSSEASTLDTGAAYTNQTLKDHIVKGVFSFADLTNGKVLKTLSGKELKITRDSNLFYVNGVLINSEAIAEGKTEAIYMVKKKLTATKPTDSLMKPQPIDTIKPIDTVVIPIDTVKPKASINIEVYDSFNASVSHPIGALSAFATVYLYHSQVDFANDLFAYQAFTDSLGIARFNNIDAGKYYVKAMKGERSNIFNKSAQKTNGVYTGYAFRDVYPFLTDSTSTLPPGAVSGNVSFMDANADGVINNNDLVAMPYENVEVSAGAGIQAIINIGYDNNFAHKP